MTYLTIDGSQGEGGGQVLRTALTLSILTKQAIELVNIRAKRKKPGLLRQHLTSVLAAEQICSAQTDGVELGSDRIRFIPGDVQPGEYHFRIGTAGSTVLVCQTILPVLMLANKPSKITFEGGTHNGMSPSLCFFEHAYLPILKQMGVTCSMAINSLGFYPAGGGKWTLDIKPANTLKPLQLLKRARLNEVDNDRCQIRALVSQLPDTIGEREIVTAKKLLNWHDVEAKTLRHRTAGPGNSLQLWLGDNTHTNVFEVTGEFGVSAEKVAKRCAGRVKAFLAGNAAVDEFLADQLLLPMALAGDGSYTTSALSLHTKTNIEIIRLFINVRIQLKQEHLRRWKIKIQSDD